MKNERRLAALTDPYALRSRWLAASTRVVESGMRSRLFLLWMRCSLTAATEAQALYSGGLLRRTLREHRLPTTRP